MVSRGDVVLVTTNYRLSTLGFLALDDGKTNGNFGIADIIAALNWVDQHISAFGGDPSRITIFGQSAGAAAVRGLMQSPKAIGKFAAAIQMSNLAGSGYGTTYSNYYTIDEEVAVAARNIIQQTNCNKQSNEEILSCLKKVDANTLVNLGTVARYILRKYTRRFKRADKTSGILLLMERSFNILFYPLMVLRKWPTSTP